MDRYDLCVVGAGPAGIAGAFRAVDLGKRVALIDGGPLGGAGIFDGALSSKTLWHLSADYSRACRSDRGYDGSALVASWPAVRAQVDAACREAQALIVRQLAAFARPGVGRGTIDHILGRGTFVGLETLEVATVDGSRRLEADRFLLAVGSRPRVPPTIAVDGVRVMTSDQIEHLPALPGRLAIIGAGVVGCEYATVFAHFKQTAVELFDRQPRILPFEDEDVAAVVASRFAEIGVHVHRKARIERVVVIGDEVEIGWLDEAGAVQHRRYDRVLVATGRAPSLGQLGLDLAGVSIDANGGVTVERTRTTAPHVWAAGDVTPDLMLANLAELEARHAVEDMYGRDPSPIVHEAQSAIYFLSPEVAAVGLDEQMARAKGIPYRAAIVSNALNRRNLAMRAPVGFVKLLARPDGHLLGLRVVGPQAGTCIQGVALLIGQGGTLAAVDRCVHPHPAVTEGVLEAARLLLGTSLYKPDAMDGLCRIVSG
ncbi:MAG: NAD(P)/FAD-dependent oxidoreductase [Deltaproteobacteria bacterium]|nr:NAD(P)/FAD-dependent oxidoreductase [Deltaproteobacteria bacterium]